MDTNDLMEQMDHPFFMLAFGITPFVIGFTAFLLWGAKNLNMKGNSDSAAHGLARTIEQ